MWNKVYLLIILTSFTYGAYSLTNHNGYEFEMIDLLGLSNRPRINHHLSLRTSASKFLLEAYKELSQERVMENRNRYKRKLRDDASLITEVDHLEIEKYSNIITFSSKGGLKQTKSLHDTIASDMSITFNTSDVPKDLQLLHSVLRIYQDPSLGRFQNHDAANTTISIFKKIYNRKQQANELRILTSINSTTTFKGWLEFNITNILRHWLQYRTAQHLMYGNEVVVGIKLREETYYVDGKQISKKIKTSDTGLIGTNAAFEEQQPFIIGYFNGPELMVKMHKLRFKREVLERKRKAEFYMNSSPPISEIYQTPKTCERLNFTLDFKDLHMHNWVIAPKKFEAFFCGGECNFPLGSKMNATNHAIVQTLMHLKRPSLPKPCCVPTVLGSISILHYLNEDSVNLSKYPQSVAQECGCH